MRIIFVAILRVAVQESTNAAVCLVIAERHRHSPRVVNVLVVAAVLEHHPAVARRTYIVKHLAPRVPALVLCPLYQLSLHTVVATLTVEHLLQPVHSLRFLGPQFAQHLVGCRCHGDHAAPPFFSAISSMFLSSSVMVSRVTCLNSGYSLNTFSAAS